MNHPAAIVDRPESTAVPAKRASVRCLVVHDDLGLRLRLASLVRRASPKIDADCITCASFDALPPERIAAYAALLLIVEFNLRDQTVDPLARLEHARRLSPRLPIFVFARGGDERNAARTIRLGADDYWPVHAVKIGELSAVMQPLVDVPVDAGSGGAASGGPAPGTSTVSASPSSVSGMPQIAGYRLVKTIAEAAAAAVYLARNDDLPQPVALKVQALKGRHEVSDADRQRFVRECQILSSLNHRSVADVLDYGVTEDYLYLALEYFPCGSLRDRLKNPLSEADAVNYARQIGEALQIVHIAHVVHRDLKPSNLMLTDDNRLILIDFGSASMHYEASDMERSDLCTGTPYYVSPEQIDNCDPDARADLYSLGVVLYEMLVGALPYAGNSLEEIFTAHRSAPVPRLPQRVLRYQPIIDRLMAKNPADRYPSAGLFLEDLSAVSAPIRTSVGVSHMGVSSS
jgi:serine/threonine-protein kinase PpkA